MSKIPTALPGNVVLDGYIDVPQDRLAAVTEALPQHIALTRAEAGCRYFDVLEDLSIAGRFNVFEIFDTRCAFDAHQIRAAASTWAEITVGIDRHYVVTEIDN